MDKLMPLKNSAAMVGHSSHSFHSNSFYTTRPLTYNQMVVQSSLSNQPKESDREARAILQYRNTPIQNIELSPAQLRLHCQLHDFILCQPTLYKPQVNWIAAAQNCEMTLSHRNACLIERYNRTAHTLCPLQKGQIVAIQRPTTGQWDTTG